MLPRKKLRLAAMLAAMLLTAVCLAGCYKGDGTEVRIPKSAKVEDNSFADQIDATFTNVSVDPNSLPDPPFPFEPVTETLSQEIIMVMIFDRPDPYNHEQSVNYFDRDGNVYCYRHPVDADGDFYSPLIEQLRSGKATVVNIMGDTERETLRYLAAHVGDYRKTALIELESGHAVYGSTKLYLIDSREEPVLIGNYAEPAEFRDNSEIISFLNWFRFFYHGGFLFG